MRQAGLQQRLACGCQHGSPDHANAGVKRVPFTTAIKAPSTHQEDYVVPYVKDLRNVVDMDAIRAAGLPHALADRLEYGQ